MLKISDIEQLNNEIFALLSTRFSYLKIAQLIKQIGIIPSFSAHYFFRLRIRPELGFESDLALDDLFSLMLFGLPTYVVERFW